MYIRCVMYRIAPSERRTHHAVTMRTHTHTRGHTVACAIHGMARINHTTTDGLFSAKQIHTHSHTPMHTATDTRTRVTHTGADLHALQRHEHLHTHTMCDYTSICETKAPAGSAPELCVRCVRYERNWNTSERLLA